MTYERNKLTEKLVAEGYTVDNHPKYVRVPNGGKSLNNFYGGFEYLPAYIDEKTFETPCGLLLKGRDAMTGMTLGGIEWSFENDCPTIICPYYKVGCEKNHEILRDHYGRDTHPRCAVHLTDKVMTYDGSLEKIRKEQAAEKERLKQEFIKEHGGRVCDQHMRFNDIKKEWSFTYDPMICAQGYCMIQNSSFEDGACCPVLGKVITREKGNVYYDVRFEGRDYSKDGTLFEGERFEAVRKDNPLFDKPIRLEIAKVIAKTQEKQINFRVRYNSRFFDSMILYKAEKGEIDFSWKVENIRAEKKLTRDLEADLKDIEAGVIVHHEFDERRQKNAEKSEKKKANKERMIRNYEKKIIELGYKNIDGLVRAKIAKLIEPSRIRELDAEHDRKEKAEKNAPVQMSIFDL